MRTGEFLNDRTPESVFSDHGIYPDYLERKFNEKLEARFSSKLWNLLEKDTIKLKRSEIWLIKKFLLIGMIRTPETMSYVKKFRRDHLTKSKEMPEITHYYYGAYADEHLIGLTDEEYRYRTIECILDLNQFVTEEVDSSLKGTAMAHYLVRLFTIGYLGFWDSSPGDSFVITDIGMTSENEVGWSEEIGLNWKKRAIMSDIMRASLGNDPQWDCQMAIIIFNNSIFHENFMIFPISSSRMIVLINPFFKLMISNEEVFGKLNLKNITCIPDKRLFMPNESTCDILDEHKEDDLYTYKPVKLTPFETRYCNALFMDRVHTWLGFESLDRIRESAKLYKKKASNYPRNDYTILYDILEKSHR